MFYIELQVVFPNQINIEQIKGDKNEEGIIDGGEEIVVSEGIVVDNRDVINNNISSSLLTIKGTCSDDTSFLFQILFLILIRFSQVQV